MIGVELVVVTALILGFTIGRWWEHDRAGGTAEMIERLDVSRRALKMARDEVRDRRASSMAAHPSGRHLKSVPRSGWGR